MPGHFKFKEYCPRVFHDLRKRFCVDDLEYMASCNDLSIAMECYVHCTCTLCIIRVSLSEPHTSDTTDFWL